MKTLLTTHDVIMKVFLLALVLENALRSGVNATLTLCGGLQNTYVCHPENPSRFDICIGEHKYTKQCPGGLHFNTKIQTCDWPNNADCGKHAAQVSAAAAASLRQYSELSKTPVSSQHSSWRSSMTFLFNSSVKEEEERGDYPITPRIAESRYRLYDSVRSGNDENFGYMDNDVISKSLKPRQIKRPAVNTGTYAHKKQLNIPQSHPSQTKDSLSYIRNNGLTRDGEDVTPLHYNSDDENNHDPFILVRYPWWTSRKQQYRYSDKGYPSEKSYNSVAARQPQRLTASAPRQQRSRHPQQVSPQQPQSQQMPVPEQKDRSASNSITAAAAGSAKRKDAPRKSGKCGPETCKLPDCRCAGTDIPSNLPLQDTPQMVMLTFDDSVNIANFDYFQKLFDDSIRNPNGCPIKGTFFVSGDSTQYPLVEKLYKRGQEIASHSISHQSPTTYWATAGYDGYVNEIEGMRKRLSEQAKVPRDTIKGMRVPFLQVGGDDQYQMLHDFQYKYDSSMVTGPLYKNDNPPVWPFTLDYPPDSKTCSLTPCPTKSYPGLWEVPLVRWYGSNRIACAMPDGCTIGQGRQGTLKYLEENFQRHYKSNRAPFGIFLHASWFLRQDGHFQGLVDFLKQVEQMKDVWVISVSQVIDWIQNPVSNRHSGTLQSWSCD